MTKENNEIDFIKVQTPDAFASRGLAELTTAALRQEKMSLSELELEKLHKINQVLNHPELMELIKENKITLAMIKPQVNESRDLSADDELAAKLLMEEIGEERIVFSLHLKLLPEDIENFYEGNEHITDIKNHFNGGAATFLLLYYEEGGAVNSWREHMGKTNPEKAGPNTIRGKYAKTVKNNLVHGSDSPEAVKREVGILRAITAEMEEKSIKTSMAFPHEGCINYLLDLDERLLAMEKTCSGVKSGFAAVIYSPRGVYRESLMLRKNKQLAKAS